MSKVRWDSSHLVEATQMQGSSRVITAFETLRADWRHRAARNL